MKAYNTSLRRSIKWYRKLVIEVVIGAALVNAHWLHQRVTNDKMSITVFRENVVKGTCTDISMKKYLNFVIYRSFTNGC